MLTNEEINTAIDDISQFAYLETEDGRTLNFAMRVLIQLRDERQSD